MTQQLKKRPNSKNVTVSNNHESTPWRHNFPRQFWTSKLSTSKYVKVRQTLCHDVKYYVIILLDTASNNQESTPQHQTIKEVHHSIKQSRKYVTASNNHESTPQHQTIKKVRHNNKQSREYAMTSQFFPAILVMTSKLSQIVVKRMSWRQIVRSDFELPLPVM